MKSNQFNIKGKGIAIKLKYEESKGIKLLIVLECKISKGWNYTHNLYTQEDLKANRRFDHLSYDGISRSSGDLLEYFLNKENSEYLLLLMTGGSKSDLNSIRFDDIEGIIEANSNYKKWLKGQEKVIEINASK